MRVLAIIPAAEGLLILPNRNLRVICGKPLIYYALNNAKKSKYIDDIVVTSNSDEILTLVGQIGGAICYKRPDELCSINISLERVINDVRRKVKFEEYDYVITMQSISPTLKTETLDKAIEQCIDENIDTLISVVAKKNYFWKNDNEIPVGLQETRVNKNQLTPYYMETGAFFISRPKFITDKTRIGGKTQLYVLDRDEAVDVFNFGDLKEAEYVLTKKKIAFYVNGNSKIGLGHIHRTMLLANEFFTKPVIFIDKNQTDRNVIAEKSYNIVSVDGKESLANELIAGGFDLLINDILATSNEYMSFLRDKLPKLKIVNFEDDGEGAKKADLVINALYNESDNENWKVGAEYYIAPKLFLMQKPIDIKEHVSKILITFGGADPQNYTKQVLEIISDITYKDYDFHVVIGPANNNGLEIEKYSNNDNVHVYKNINNLLPLMSKCDLAIAARGRTGFELALCGVPTICMAQNEREERHSFLSEKNGYYYIGYKPDNETLEKAIRKMLDSSKEDRLNMQMKMQKHDLRNGRKRIIDLINEL